MAALIHQCHHPATDPAALSPSSHTLIRRSQHLFNPSQITSFLSPSKPPLSLSPYKPHHHSDHSSSLSRTPTLQHLLAPKSLERTQPLSNHELSRLLKLSVEYADIQLNKAAHASILKVHQDVRLFNSLISSYIELGHLDYAEKVFNSILSPDVVSYTAMISGLAKSGRENDAIRLFFEMRGSGIEPNGYTFVALLTACMRLLDLQLGSQLHAFSIKTGQFNCTYVANALMGLYGKCGCLDFVIKLFEEMPSRDIASWNTVISCVVNGGMYDRAFELFHDMMIVDGFRVDYFTLSSLLVACARCFATFEGRGIHAYAYKIGYESSLSVRNALI
ncbi:hypothetical protein CDL12_23218 [Handroanthus impetiginosus]|uniref:Pentatricopeptide repeat-containing protein n=1 Tax=Handroanthus impetiginosus TaxID=429701 RepID=A0A2G9GG42_9LAMI|nr:hypothetical protein CDL12_23218 [Handroanthus impetiginosus]